MTKKQSVNKAKKNTSVQTKKKHKLKIFILIAIVLLAIDIFLTGYMKFAYNTAICGHPPLQSTPNGLFGGTSGYASFGDKTYMIAASNHYYCSVEQAEAVGEVPNPRSEEGIRQSEERSKQLEKEGDELLEKIKEEQSQ